MTLLDKARGISKALWGVTIGHAAHDAWYGVAPVLLAALSSELDISNADIGLILLFYQGISAASQPFFGRLSERIGGRKLGVFAILWTTLMFCGVILAPSKLVISICVALAGIGSGAWHPQATANATIAGGSRYGATSASIFFFGGILGTAFLGAALGGFLLEQFGRSALLIIAVITITLALTAVRKLVPDRIMPEQKTKEPQDGAMSSQVGNAFWTLLAFLLLGTALRSLSNNSLQTYVPKYLNDLGTSPATYGLITSLFLFASAVGGIVGSYLADKIGLRHVLAGSMVLAALLLLGFVNTEGTLGYVLLVLVGLAIGPSHTLLVVAGQRRFPQRMAMVSGIFLGFTFVSGAGGAWVIGLLADRIGLYRGLGLLPWTLLGAAACSLVSVPSRKSMTTQEQGAAAE